MAKWLVRAKRADFKALADKYGIDQVVARLLVNRDVPEEEFAQFLHPDVSDMHDPGMLLHAPEAAGMLAEAIRAGKHIRVIGDYDIDGICSTYILIRAIGKCGGTVDYRIPHRMTDGYGLNERLIREAADEGIDLIITCDNGIAAYDEIALARELGVSVIVTDHHAVPYDENESGERDYRIPPADIVVDPHINEDAYPFKDICGAVVAWKVVQLLYAGFGYDATEAIDEFIEPAAFATVGDIMPLINENRVIVRIGLDRISRTRIVGLNALIEQIGVDRDHLSTYHIGYVLGPCFNASGRLDTATLAVELLLEDDPAEAVRRASELVTLNTERKQMTETGTAEAFRMIEEQGLDSDPVIVVYVPTLHESLCGIVAGRIREKYYRPTFVICDGETCAKGSGRSIEAYSMYDRMNECADLFIKFGGHPMAAGLSIEASDIDELRRRLNENAGLTEDDLTPKVMIDVPMPIGYIRLDLIRQINALEPFGTANEKPVFADKDLSIRHITQIGQEKQYRKLIVADEAGRSIEALYFGDAQAFDEAVTEESKLKVVYEPQINSYRGNETPQIVIKEFEAV